MVQQLVELMVVTCCEEAHYVKPHTRLQYREFVFLLLTLLLDFAGVQNRTL
jgi:hypothetical protein